MRRVFLVSLVLAFALGLAGCGKKGPLDRPSPHKKPDKQQEKQQEKQEEPDASRQ